MYVGIGKNEQLDYLLQFDGVFVAVKFTYL